MPLRMASFIKHFAGKPLNTTKYQAVLSYTDPVPPSTNQYRSLLTQYHTASMVHWLGSSFVFVPLWWHATKSPLSIYTEIKALY